MDLWFNQEKITRLSIVKGTTIKDIKKRLSEWLIPQGFIDYEINMFIGESKIDPIVFRSSQYDEFKLYDKNISIYITYEQKTQLEYFNYNILQMLIERLPGKSAVALCNTSTKFREICTRNENKIYNFLYDRDYGIHHVSERRPDTPKENYLSLLREYGTVYVADIEIDQNGYPSISDKLRIPRMGDDDNKIVRFYDRINIPPGTKMYAFVKFKSDDEGKTFWADETDNRITIEEISEYNHIPEDLLDTSYEIEGYGRYIYVYQIKEVIIDG